MGRYIFQSPAEIAEIKEIIFAALRSYHCIRKLSLRSEAFFLKKEEK